MKTSISTLIMALAATTLAVPAPSAIEKRATGTLILYSEPGYLGSSFTVDLNVSGNGGVCIRESLPGFDNQASSVKVTGQTDRFNCQLIDKPKCEFGTRLGVDYTWPFHEDVPDLKVYADGDSNFDNRASSVWCAPVDGGK